jgi:hypothetical protein
MTRRHRETLQTALLELHAYGEKLTHPHVHLCLALQTLPGYTVIRATLTNISRCRYDEAADELFVPPRVPRPVYLGSYFLAT